MKIYGLHTVKAVLSGAGDKTISKIFVSDRQDSRMQELLQLANRLKIPVEIRPKKDLDAWAGEGVHQGVVAEFTGQLHFSESDLDTLLERDEPPRLLLALDGVQDPHNIGAILRTCDAACIDGLLLVDTKTDLYNPNTIRSSIGCIFSVQTVVSDSDSVIKWLKEKVVSLEKDTLAGGAVGFYHFRAKK